MMALGISDRGKQYLLSTSAHLTILLILLFKPVIHVSTAHDDIFALPLQDKSLPEARINLNKFRFNNSRNPLIDFRNSRCKFSSFATRVKGVKFVHTPNTCTFPTDSIHDY